MPVEDCNSAQVPVDDSNVPVNEQSLDKIEANEPIYSRFDADKTVDLVSIPELSKLISKHLVCGQCHQAEGVSLVVNKRVGIASRILLSCSKCGLQATHSNSNVVNVGSEEKPENVQSLNLALVAASRLVGVGEVGVKRLCGYMNLNHPASEWQKNVAVVYEAFRERAQRSMDEALQAAAMRSNSPGDYRGSGDGSWHRKGFASLTGLTSLVDYTANKVIGVDVRAKYCPRCRRKGRCAVPSKCSKNYEGSSGGMEPEGLIAIVTGIYHRTGFRLTRYLGDGDTKAFTKLKEALANMDEPWEVTKDECVNHVNKRMGARFRKTTKEMKGVMVDGRSGIGGKNRITVKAMGKMQAFFSFVIHFYGGDVKLMSLRVMAIYYHIASTDTEPRHQDCDPRFCGYLKDPVAYKHKEPHFHIAPAVMTHIKGDFEAMADPILLEKCASGKTQNANECFNSTVWKMLHKDGFANRKLVELTVFMAVVRYNEGQSAVLEVLANLGHEVGSKGARRSLTMDNRRRADKRRKEAKTAAGIKRQRTLGAEDAEEEPTYLSGAAPFV